MNQVKLRVFYVAAFFFAFHGIQSELQAGEVVEVDVDSRAIHRSDPPVIPRAYPVFNANAVQKYVTEPNGTSNPANPREQKMFQQYYPSFKGYFDKLPKSSQVPMAKLQQIVAEVRAESDQNNHRFALHDVKDGCFLRNILFKSKLAEHGIDITKSTASIISRHGWLRESSASTNKKLNELVNEKTKLIEKLHNLNIWNPGQKGMIRSRLAAIELEIANLPHAAGQENLPRWTYHSVCVIQTDQGPYVFDPDVKTRHDRFKGNLLSSLSDWMKFDWNHHDPNFILAPYNYTDVFQLKGIPPKAAAPHDHRDKTYGHLFGRTPDDPIWKKNQSPPILLEKNTLGKLQPYEEEIAWKVEAMKPQAFMSQVAFDNRTCRVKNPVPSEKRKVCLQSALKKYCAAVYDYELEDESDADEIAMAVQHLRSCVRNLRNIRNDS